MPKKYMSAVVFVAICIVVAIVITVITRGSSSNGWQAPNSGPDMSARPQTGPDGKVLSTKVASSSASVNTGTMAVYTLADVTAHATASSCWTAINGDVYDVTTWINKHPGGQQSIIGLCGRDGSDAFNGQHGGERRPANELATFKIGILKK